MHDIEKRIRLRRESFGENSFGGNCFVLRPCGTPIKLNELAAQESPDFRHQLLGPEGVVSVSVDIGAHTEYATTLMAVNRHNRPITFATNCTRLFLDRSETTVNCLELTEGQVLRGFRMFKKERVEEEVTMANINKRRKLDHYMYRLSPGPLYIGSNNTPIFLPFMVT